MAKKNGLPSAEPVKTERKAEVRCATVADGQRITTGVDVGYASRSVDVRMTGNQPHKFKAILRHLEDSGAKLADGSFVNNKRRAVLYLIESFDLTATG